MIDGHVWPAPDGLPAHARTVCDHIDYERVWAAGPELFGRRAQVGAPAPELLWQAKDRLSSLGVRLAFDVHVENIGGEPAVAVYGAGVVGALPDRAWEAVAGLLTTCCTRFTEPRGDVDRFAGLVRPARSPSVSGMRPCPRGVTPETVSIGDHLHTWWQYPVHGRLTEDCPCPAHTAQARRPAFGPGSAAAPMPGATLLS